VPLTPPCSSSKSAEKTTPLLQTTGTTPTPPQKPPDPWRDAPPTEYADSWLDTLLIGLFTRKLAAAAGVPATLGPAGTPVVYSDFVRVARDDIMARSRLSPRQQRSMVLKVLLSLMPPGLPALFRALFPPTRMSAELNARVAAATFRWLVGDMELREGEVVISGDGGGVGGGGGHQEEGGGAGQAGAGTTGPTTRLQRSVVHIKRCRFLEQSGCAGACVQMCKLPTQEFFAREFGLPLTMTPNFEDLSCDMVFGQAAPSAEEDPALRQPCFRVACPTAVPSAPACPQVLAAAAEAAAEEAK
jgi:hypothetical protein